MNKANTTPSAPAPTDDKSIVVQPPKPTKPPAILLAVQHKIDSLVAQQRLTFPDDYNVANALASARVALLSMDSPVIDGNGQPTGKCTPESLFNAVFDMCVQGMNVGKDQGYLINYGGVLTWQRSYFGDQLLAKRIRNFEIEPYADVVYEDELPSFKIAKVRNKSGALITVITNHDLNPLRGSGKIVAAYCGSSVIATGEDQGIELMNMDQIKMSWSKSKTYKGGTNTGTFHTQQPDKACKRTVIRRWATPIFNTSDDSLLKASIRRQDEEAILAEASEEFDSNQGTELLPIEAANPDNSTETREADPVTGEVIEGDQPKSELF